MKSTPRRRLLVRAMIAIALLVVATCAQAANTYEGGRSVYTALREQPRITLEVGGGRINVVFADNADGLDRERALQWIRRSAEAVSIYFGRFPVKEIGVLVVTRPGDRVVTGTTFGYGSSAIRMLVGRDCTDAAYADDWVLVHEMTHLALPELPSRNAWLMEGNATYVEPIARAQAGQLDRESVWRWSLRGMPKGLPVHGDLGLDNTPTWGRKYWGGAIFWLLVDVRLREATKNRIGAQDALRAINRRSSGNTSDWSADELMAAGDAATKTTVMSDLYAQMRDDPMPVDLGALFEQLGISESKGKIRFDDNAPLAAVRRSITAVPNSNDIGG
ncbi:MAG: hypothetical protein ABIR16_00225 [Dokdonella sp.]